MKKFFLAAIAVLAFANVNAQEFKAGINAGIPVGDAGDLTTFAIAVDLAYLFEVSEDFHAGPVTGYGHAFGDEIDLGGFGTIEVDDFQYIPIGATGRYSVSDDFTIGADLGYALGLGDGSEGGFYYNPRVQYGVSDALDIVLAYRNVSDDGFTASFLTLGVEFGL
ncbi:hypothetical protein [Psychroserpens algicola]|uniref:Outer membrane protein beta-barrel domain-containing protein n=1 Tax=Psychroserpens algicola TaxID=1719034 RepID=A0ABT0H6C8_9FLAO|nr:hypothetical protein [Psychroserpens algicola]MCK8479906.1 hypothetical protein [Psychroserpens algicola]